jgi:hypothetical protein
MEEEYAQQDIFQEIGVRVRDVEERQQLLKDRLLLVGKSVLDERERLSVELQTLKKNVLLLTEENVRCKEVLQRLAEQLNNTARKEELLILQRQFDLFRKAGE